MVAHQLHEAAPVLLALADRLGRLGRVFEEGEFGEGTHPGLEMADPAGKLAQQFLLVGAGQLVLRKLEGVHLGLCLFANVHLNPEHRKSFPPPFSPLPASRLSVSRITLHCFCLPADGRSSSRPVAYPCMRLE